MAKTAKKTAKKAKLKPASFKLREWVRVRVRLADIEANEVQPDRTSDGKLRSLMDSLELTGFIAPPVCARLPNGKWQHLDGWRRVEAARRLGLVELDIIDVGDIKSEAVQWFIAMNAGTRRCSGTDWLEVWSKAPNKKKALARMPSMTRGRIEGLIDYLGGEEELAKLVGPDKEVAIKSPTLFDIAEKTYRLLDCYPRSVRRASHRAITKWLAKYSGMTSTVKALWELDTSTERRNHVIALAEAIWADEAYHLKKKEKHEQVPVRVVHASATVADSAHA